MDCMEENPNRKPLAIVSVPWQHFENVTDPANGLAQGTIFDDLVLPFYGVKAACNVRQKNQMNRGRRCGC